MDPLSAASAFATIVGLIGQFRGERASNNQPNLAEFQDWLHTTHRSDIKALLDQQSKMTEGIKIMLAEERGAFLEKLEAINTALITYSSQINGFSQIAEAINPNLGLSNQAISILTQFEDAKASKALDHHVRAGLILTFIDGKGGNIDITEQRFLEDDLKKLVGFGLLIHGHTPKGSNLYTITREASNLVKSIKIDS
jgi:hypothetical protein